MVGGRQRRRKRQLKKTKQEKSADCPSQEEHIDMSTGTFHPFPRLPLELRRQIFLELLLEPRILTVFEQQWPIHPRPGTWDNPADHEADRANSDDTLPRPRFFEDAIQKYGKRSLHPWEARILKPIDQRILAKREKQHASQLMKTKLRLTPWLEDIWRKDSSLESPEVTTFTAAEGLYPDLQTVSFWKTPYFRDKIIEHTSANPVLCETLHSQLTVRFERETRRPTPPILLQICRDSRDLAMEHYQLAFGGRHNSANQAFDQAYEESRLGQKKIWVDFTRDMIFINPRIPDIILTPDYQKIRNLAVLAERYWWYPRSCRDSAVTPSECEWQKRMMATLRQLPDLKTLTVYYTSDRACSFYCPCEAERFPEHVEATLLYLFAQPPGKGLEPFNIDWRVEKRKSNIAPTWDWDSLYRRIAAWRR